MRLRNNVCTNKLALAGVPFVLLLAGLGGGTANGSAGSTRAAARSCPLDTACSSRLYVDAASAAESPDGLRWSSAFRDLQDALSVASVLDSCVTEIRVARGTYRPGPPDATRDVSFRILDGVSIVGGFAGSGSATPDDRNLLAFRTILSGDLDGDDCTDPNQEVQECLRNNNVLHVVQADQTRGGDQGLLAKYFPTDNLLGEPVVRIDPQIDFFWHGEATPDGIPSGSAFSTRWVGAVLVPVSGSWSFYVQADDGVRLWIDGRLIIDEWKDQAPTFVPGCEALTLEAGRRYSIRMEFYEGGGEAAARLLWSGPGNPLQVIPTQNLSPPIQLDGVTIEGGRADECCDSCDRRMSVGGGLTAAGGYVRVSDCTFRRNFACADGGAMAIDESAVALVEDCEFQDNAADDGGAIFLSTSTAQVARSRFLRNFGHASGGALRLLYSSGAFVGCDFRRNLSRGGSTLSATGSFAQFTNCLLARNRVCGKASGTITMGTRSLVVVVNSTIAANEACRGICAGVCEDEDDQSSRAVIYNSILWRNRASMGATREAQLGLDAARTTLRSSCIEGELLGGEPSVGIINTDPKFERFTDIECAEQEPHCGTNAAIEDDRYELTRASDCVDNGDNSLLPLDVQADLNKNPRIAGFASPLVIDMGAYELQPQCPEQPTCAECSTWIAMDGRWSDPPDGAWCPAISPNNTATDTFHVIVSEPDSEPAPVVSLNVSPTIDSLFLGAGARLQVDLDSSAVQTLAVVAAPAEGTPCGVPPHDVSFGFVNAGELRALDGRRLVLDGSTIDQRCGGVIEALGPGSVVQISGAVVLGGEVRTDAGGEIRLVGGSELVGTAVDGVVVPDGQSGAFSASIINLNAIHVNGVSANAILSPMATDPSAAVLRGDGCVRLARRPFSKLGDPKFAFTNDVHHRIEGAGVVIGGVLNKGRITADVISDELLIAAPGAKICAAGSAFEAIHGGVLCIADDIDADPGSGGGVLLAVGGTIRLVAPEGPVHVSATTVEIKESEEGPGGHAAFPSGMMTAGADTRLSAKAVTVGPGGTLRRDHVAPPGDGANAEFFFDELNIRSRGGTSLSGTMSGRVSGELRLRDDKGGGVPPPPILRVYDHARLRAGATVLDNPMGEARLAGGVTNSVETTYRSSEPLELAGDFENHSRDPSRFDWLRGGISLLGSATQRFEVAGDDVGPSLDGFRVGSTGECGSGHSNFSIGTIDVAGVGEVQFVNEIDNEAGQALYVGTLILHETSTFSIRGSARVYYAGIIGDSFLAGACLAGCDQLQPISCPEGPSACLPLVADCPLKDCMMGPGGGISRGCAVHDQDADADVDMLDLMLANPTVRTAWTSGP